MKKDIPLLRNQLQVVCLIMLFSVFSSVAAQAEISKSKIAVLDFELHGNNFSSEHMGSMVGELFTTALVRDGRFDVIERAMLQTILEEQHLSASGIIDDRSASKIGKVLGVDVLISGSILKLDDTIEVNSRIINVEDGTIVAAESIKCLDCTDLFGKIDVLTDRIVKNFPFSGYIVKRDGASVIIDLGTEAGLRNNMEFIVFREGEVIKHPKTGAILDVHRTNVGRIRIEKIHNNISEGVIISEIDHGIEYGLLVRSAADPTPKPQSSQLGDGWALGSNRDANLPDNLLSLNIAATPHDAVVRILNIQERYQDDMLLPEGAYIVEVAKPSYRTTTKQLMLSAGNKVRCQVELQPLPNKASSPQESVVASDEQPLTNPLAKKLTSRELKQVIAAAKQITSQGSNVIDQAIYDVVEQRLLRDYKTKKGSTHVEAMSWLCKALAGSHDPKYKETLEAVAYNSSSFKLTLHASKSLLML